MTAKKTKHIGIECCRILAMLMICNLHVLGMGGILEKVDSQKDLYYIFANFLEAFSYSAVNIYILISGYVGLYSQFSYKKMFSFFCCHIMSFYIFLFLYTFYQFSAFTSNIISRI